MSNGDGDKVWVHLFGGEQDGFRLRIELKTKTPKRFYIWHVNDKDKIDAAKGMDRHVVQKRLATMAYELFDEVEAEDGHELRYRRLESADKEPAPNPAT